ncbi:hypothetical protein HBI58_090650 [Parastagonospora nodorum]|nr:hypothetical protein HBI58_090650 [Parastagonospora nodorum]
MLQIYYIVRYTNNARNTSQTHEPRRYASSNKETPIILLSQLLINNRMTLYIRGLENSASASLLIYSDYALQECSLLKVTATYALNYLKLQVLKLTLIGIVLYNAIKEYYDDRIRKIIYFYSYTIENDYHDNDCRTGHSNEEDIEANEREEETKVRLRELLEEIHNILLREFRKANDFIESIIYNDNEQELELEDCDALVERYEEEINCSDLYSTI